MRSALFTLWFLISLLALTFSPLVIAQTEPIDSASSVDSETQLDSASPIDSTTSSQPPFVSAATHYQAKYIDEDEHGYWVNSTSDSYLTLGGFDVPRSRACYLIWDVEFKEPMFRPGLFEAFWAVNPQAFSEAQKARFLISHKDTEQRTLFVVPLCKLYNYSGNLNSPHHQGNIVGLRLDYPMNRTIGLKIHRVDLVGKDQIDEIRDGKNWVELEPFERLRGTPFKSLDVAAPKVFFGFENGARRLVKDWPFLFFWLALIICLLGLMVRGRKPD